MFIDEVAFLGVKIRHVFGFSRSKQRKIVGTECKLKVPQVPLRKSKGSSPRSYIAQSDTARI